MSIQKVRKEFQQIVEDANPYAGREGLVYVRVSSKRQEKEGHGRESQEERCKQDLRSIGVPFVKTFPDTFTGAGDFMLRPAMRAMLAYIDAHPHKKFVVDLDDLKRLARDVNAHFKLRAAFKIRDIKLRCPNYNFDESEEGEFVELIFAGQAQLERKQNRRQVIQKMKARLELGYWSFGGKRGYDMIKDPLHGKLLVPNKDGRILKEALEAFASGNLIRKVDVARFLFKRKYWKNSKRTAEHYLDEVSAMLQDVVHCGDVEYAPWGIARRKGRHRGIISVETFELIQKRLRKEVSGTRIRRDVSSDFSLRGLVLCPECKQKLTGAFCKGRSKTYPYYYCMTKGCALRSKMLSKADLESDFDTLLRRNRLKAETDELVQLTFERVWKQEVVGLKQQENLNARRQEQLQDKLRELTELARTTRSDAVRRAYEEQIEATAKEIEQGSPSGSKRDLAVPYRTALAKSTGMLKNPVMIWQKAGPQEKQRLYFFLFDERLPYTKCDGFRTANSLSSTRLFEEFCEQNSDDVDPTGIEPVTSSLQMRRSTK